MSTYSMLTEDNSNWNDYSLDVINEAPDKDRCDIFLTIFDFVVNI